MKQKENPMFGMSSCGVVMALSLVAGLASGQQQQQGFLPSDIPLTLANGANEASLYGGHQLGRVSFRAHDKSVIVDWVAREGIIDAPDFPTDWDPLAGTSGGKATRKKTQVLPTAFYPTAVGRLSAHQLLVAGIKTNGRSIMQRWTFDLTNLPEPSTNNMGISEVDVVIATHQRTTLHTGSPAGPYIAGVTGLRILGQPCSHALVQYHSPNDIMQFDLSTGAMVLLGSETDGSASLGTIGSLSVPDYSGIQSSDHTAAGYVYMFSRRRTDLHEHVNPSLILLFTDADRDGSVDFVSELTQSQYEQQGLHQLDNYSEWWLE